MNLIIQAAHPIAATHLDRLMQLAQSRLSEQLSAQAFRLTDAAPDPGIAPYCLEHSLDYGFVPDGRSLRNIGLVVMDMDSTLITIECIDEIADMLGVKPQVATITAAAMRGEIDFRESLTQRVALLAGLPVEALERVYDERLRLAPGAARMIEGFAAAGARTLLVSGSFTYFTDRLQARLRLDGAAANTLEIADGRLTGRLTGSLVDAQEKAARFTEMRRRACADGGIAIAIGDGANDLPMLRAADVSVAYRAKPVVRAEATYAVNYCGIDAVLNLFA
jgi:phosphoserine phosphatase